MRGRVEGQREKNNKGNTDSVVEIKKPSRKPAMAERTPGKKAKRMSMLDRMKQESLLPSQDKKSDEELRLVENQQILAPEEAGGGAGEEQGEVEAKTQVADNNVASEVDSSVLNTPEDSDDQAGEMETKAGGEKKARRKRNKKVGGIDFLICKGKESLWGVGEHVGIGFREKV